MLETHERLVVVRLSDTPPGRGLGQSAAFGAGVQAARGQLIAMIDADGQNDPADLPALLALMASSGADLVQGDRSGRRRDTLGRRVGSVVGRLFRRGLLGDTVRDTGCSLRVMRAEVVDWLGGRWMGRRRRSLRYEIIERPRPPAAASGPRATTEHEAHA